MSEERAVYEDFITQIAPYIVTIENKGGTHPAEQCWVIRYRLPGQTREQATESQEVRDSVLVVCLQRLYHMLRDAARQEATR